MANRKKKDEALAVVQAQTEGSGKTIAGILKLKALIAEGRL